MNVDKNVSLTKGILDHSKKMRSGNSRILGQSNAESQNEGGLLSYGFGQNPSKHQAIPESSLAASSSQAARPSRKSRKSKYDESYDDEY